MQYLAECFRREGDVLIWKERPASHFEKARHPDAMRLFNETHPGKVAGSKDHIQVGGHGYKRKLIIAAMKEAGS